MTWTIVGHLAAAVGRALKDDERAGNTPVVEAASALVVLALQLAETAGLSCGALLVAAHLPHAEPDEEKAIDAVRAIYAGYRAQRQGVGDPN